MRSKLKLDLENLTVDSFDTANETGENGTVFGEECTCPGAATCDHTACGQQSCGCGDSALCWSAIVPDHSCWWQCDQH